MWASLRRYFRRYVWILLVGFAAAGCAQAPTEAKPAPTIPPPKATPAATIAPPRVADASAAPTVEAPTGIPAEDCGESSGSLEEDTYRGVAVAQDIPYKVYLPPCYGETAKRYPALYLLHGHPFDEAHWVTLGAVEAMEEGMAAGHWGPLIMVMPLQPEPLFRSSDGGPGSYETELMEGLIPHIEAQFRTDPNSRGLAGVSRGGVWALEIGLRNPQEFQGVAALSPALAVNSARPPYDPFEIIAASDRIPLRIYLFAGEEDWAAVETQRLSEALSAAGIDHMFQITAGDHSNPTWAAVMLNVIGYMALATAP